MDIRGLYAIVDADALEGRGLDFVAVAEGLLAARPAVVQLRAKRWGDARVVEALRWLRGRLPRGEGLLFANDRADLAQLAGCDGVHVGQNDPSVDFIRRHFPELAVGLSTHDPNQLEAALALPLAYAALGPIFSTSSKENPEPVVGLEKLVDLGAQARSRGVPLVAIGGIDRERGALVAPHVASIAVIGALLPPPGFTGDVRTEVEARARAFALLPYGARP